MSEIKPGIALGRIARYIVDLEADRDALREALEWYANPEIYEPHPHGLAFDNRDLSYHAKAALVRRNGESQS